MQSESENSVRDEGSSSGLPEDDLLPHTTASIAGGGGGRSGPLSGVSWEQRGSTSTLSSCSTTSQQQQQARLVQSSSLQQPPPPPPRTSSAMGGSAGGNLAGSSQQQQQSELGKKTTCMQCYLSGHSDGSVDSADQQATTSSAGSSCGGGGTPRDRDSGLGPECDTAAPHNRGDAASPPLASAEATSVDEDNSATEDGAASRAGIDA
jgi:hypothetical protein